MKKLVTVGILSVLFSSASWASSVCILVNSGSSGLFLACDGVDLTSTLKNDSSSNYTDTSVALQQLVDQGYEIVSQSDQGSSPSTAEKTIWTLVKK